MIMFSGDVYRAVLGGYNRDAMVVVGVAVAAGVWLLVLVLRNRRLPAAPVYVALAASWAWLGVVFHGMHFASINLAAPWFAGISLLQAVALLQFAFGDGRATRVGGLRQSPAGAAWLAVALLFGPAMALAGTAFDSVGYFGTAPHTLGFLTAGLVLLTDRAPWLRCLPAALLGVVDAGTAILIGEPAIALAWLLLALTLGVAAWRRRQP